MLESEIRPRTGEKVKAERTLKVGDRVIFKSREDVGGRYNFGGDCQAGETGVVKAVSDYLEEKYSYEVLVKFDRSSKRFGYSMLESELIKIETVDTPTAIHIEPKTLPSFDGLFSQEYELQAKAYHLAVTGSTETDILKKPRKKRKPSMVEIEKIKY